MYVRRKAGRAAGSIDTTDVSWVVSSERVKRHTTATATTQTTADWIQVTATDGKRITQRISETR